MQETDFITQALASRAAGPIVGATAIVLSWLLSKWRHEIPLREQLAHAGRVALRALPWSLGALGLVLVAGAGPFDAIGVGITVLLIQAGFTLPRPPAPPAPRSELPTVPGVAMLAALGMVASCSMLPALAQVGAGAQYLGSLIEVADAGARAWLDRHPSLEAQQQIDTTLRRARQALALLDAAVAAGDDIEAARLEALSRYEELRMVLEQVGVLDAVAPEGGAESGAPDPEPLALPTAVEVAEVM